MSQYTVAGCYPFKKNLFYILVDEGYYVDPKKLFTLLW